MKGNLRSRLIGYFTAAVLISAVALGSVIWNTGRLQTIADQRFREEIYLQDLQEYVEAAAPALREYLTTWSSTALSSLLFNMERIRELTPQQRPIVQDEQDLKRRELFHLLDSYLASLTEIIDLKRGRKVDEYTAAFEELTALQDYIRGQIDTLSLLGFRNQLNEYQEFLVLFRRIQIYSLLQVLLAVAFAYTLLIRSINTVVVPLSQIAAMAEELSNNRFDIEDIHFASIRELSVVAEALNNMKHSISGYVVELQRQREMEQQVMNERLRNLRMEQLLKRMELYTMQAQMNPHFLFNTLNTGVQLAILEDADKTAEFMDKLATLFRNNTREKDFFVPLRYEIEGLKIYFDILRIRFPKTLDLELSVDEALLDRFRCPSMVLQPLVENSVLHAFGGKQGKGRISVSVRFEDPFLRLVVADDGNGISKDIVGALLVPHTHDYQLSAKVMGLENVIQRFYFYYPDQAEVISIDSSPGQGTRIVMNIHTEVEPCIES